MTDYGATLSPERVPGKGRNPPRPWKNAFAEDGDRPRQSDGGRVCELIQDSSPDRL